MEIMYYDVMWKKKSDNLQMFYLTAYSIDFFEPFKLKK